jgi:hypothetical protein
VQALIQAGRLPAQKIGMQHLIQPADLAKVRDRKPGRPPKLDTAPDAARRETLKKVGLPVDPPKPRDPEAAVRVKALRKKLRNHKRK